MIRRAIILGLCLFTVPVLYAGEVLDSIIATVNGHVILQSDLQNEMRYACFFSGRALQSNTPADSKAALDRLIDRELLNEQASSVEFKAASPEDVEKQVESAKKDFARDHAGQSWSEALAACQLGEGDIRDHFALELSQLRMVDAHLRPSIDVDTPAIEAYYREHMAPGTPGGQITLKAATPAIRELLTQQKMDSLLISWLGSLRSQAQVKMLASDSSPEQGPAQ